MHTIWESRLPLMNPTLFGAWKKMHAQYLILIPVGLPPKSWSHIPVAIVRIDDVC